MFPLKGIREHITGRLDTEIGVLKKHRSEKLSILESTKENKGDEVKYGKLLNEVVVINLPKDNLWIFDNEFGDRKTFTMEQSRAFSSAGKKVETTIIYHFENRLYLFMIEMKRAISPEKYITDVVKKFEHSLSSISVFISAHTDFPALEAEIYAVGICCYNSYKENPNGTKDPALSEGRFAQEYNIGRRQMIERVEPLSLNRMKIPVLLFENPNDPKSDSFELDFNNIIKMVQPTIT